MQLPKRKKEDLERRDDHTSVVYLTRAGIASLRAEIERLDTVDRPQAVKDVAEAREKGDLSENAEYQEARARLSRTEARIIRLTARLKRVVEIEESKNGVISIGSNVRMTHGTETRSYEIVGTDETDPSAGRISFRSPLGERLMGKTTGDHVMIRVKGEDVGYEIADVH